MKEDYRLDLLPHFINNPKFPQCYIGYTSATTQTFHATVYGTWVGYQNGKPFFQMQFREKPHKGLKTDKLRKYLTSVNALFEGAVSIMEHRPLVVLTSTHLYNVFKAASLWNKTIDFGIRARMFGWFNVFNPEFAVYDANIPPFSILKELTKQDKKESELRIGRMQMYDWKEFKDEQATLEINSKPMFESMYDNNLTVDTRLL